MNKLVVLLSIPCMVLLPSCSSLTLENVDYGWPVESVTTVSPTNMVSEGHYALSFNIAPVAQEEFQDTTALRGSQIRILRDQEGYYFLTGPKFKHVYVFQPGRHELKKESVIEISQTGLQNPALNLRPPYVELLDGEGFRRIMDRGGIIEEGKQ
jgi:hypothetical protein